MSITVARATPKTVPTHRTVDQPTLPSRSARWAAARTHSYVAGPVAP